MKVVAISQRIDDYPERNERRDALDQKLSSFILACGLIPAPVPNGWLCGITDEDIASQRISAWLSSINPSAILLSGGNDVGTCADRDWTEKRLLDYTSERQLPVLGICRGMQIMATMAGSKLKKVREHVRTRHILNGKISGEVNSFHDFGLAACPSSYTVLAQSEDGEIEAIRHKVLPWEGWMWHPEREDRFCSRDVNRLTKLFGD